MKLLNVGLPGQEIPCLLDSNNSIIDLINYGAS